MYFYIFCLYFLIWKPSYMSLLLCVEMMLILFCTSVLWFTAPFIHCSVSESDKSSSQRGIRFRSYWKRAWEGLSLDCCYVTRGDPVCCKKKRRSDSSSENVKRNGDKQVQVPEPEFPAGIHTVEKMGAAACACCEMTVHRVCCDYCKKYKLRLL